MKITKTQLRQIIKEEIESVLETHEPFIGDPSPSVSLGSLWQDLNTLLERWPDKEHPYYTDLLNLMEDYSSSPDRPTRLPPEPEEDVPGKEVVDLRGKKPNIGRLRRKLKHGWEDWRI